MAGQEKRSTTVGHQYRAQEENKEEGAALELQGAQQSSQRNPTAKQKKEMNWCGAKRGRKGG